MAAPEGNQFWKARTTHGKGLAFTPDELWQGAQEYFVWVEDNPLNEEKVWQYQGEIVRTTVNKLRPMTLIGLSTFLGITHKNWIEYTKRDGYGEVTTRVDQIIREQKFAGATADLMNANIIARDLGLADRREVDNTHKFTDDTDAELQRKLDQLRKKESDDTDP